MITLPTPAQDSAAFAVLLVDDHEADRRTARRQLERGGFQVHAAANGHEALSMAARFKPAGVVMDVRMPGLSGLHVLAQLRGEPDLRDVPVVLISAEYDDESVARALGAGADDFLPKPIDFWQLRARLAMLLYERSVSALADQHEQLQWVCEASTDGFIVVDGQGRVQALNAAASELLCGVEALRPGMDVVEQLIAQFHVPEHEALRRLVTDRDLAVPPVWLLPYAPPDGPPAAGPLLVTACGREPRGRLLRVAPPPPDVP